MRVRFSILALSVACAGYIAGAVPVAARQQPAPGRSGIAMPMAAGSLKFAVLGDFGDASKREFDTAAQFVKAHDVFPFTIVPLTGDNLYGSERPQDFAKKFEMPFKPLLDNGVKFYGALGNHDAREQRYYKLFNMDGKLYYSFKAPQQNVRFFALESGYMDPEQLSWLDNELKSSSEDWKIAYFHHPLYSSGKTHGSDLDLRRALEPLFMQYNVSVVFQGHDHVYERLKPQHGIQYWVIGSGGRFREGDLQKNTGLTAKGYDADNAFLLAEISGDTMTFNAVSRTGQVVDSGEVTRRKAK
ncbi:MAG TPA: metallophosphoesterase [Vicinamibacterales bacterium]|nr:metallophosphoesterase [Vicinamibacterales bacterium]